MSEPLRIVHAIARLNVGGAARHVLELAAAQRADGHEVVVVAGTLAEGEESMAYLGERLGVDTIDLPALQRELSPRRDAAAVRALRRILRERGPHVLHTHTAKAGATGRVAARIAGRGRPRILVHTYHGHVLSGYFDPGREQVYRRVRPKFSQRRDDCGADARRLECERSSQPLHGPLHQRGSEMADLLCYGEQSFLISAWHDAANGRKLMQSQRERSLRRELAQGQRAAEPEVVTITASADGN